jgi:hypothetical protein
MKTKDFLLMAGAVAVGVIVANLTEKYLISKVM